MITILPEAPDAGPAIEHLLDIAFGPGRKSRPSYKVRAGVPPAPGLSFVALDDDTLAGVIRFTLIRAGEETSAALLGPIAVHPDHGNLGIGSRLMEAGLAAARENGLRLIVAIGEPGYLARFGFEPAAPYGLQFPVPVADERFVLLPLVEGATGRLTGTVAAHRP